MTLSRVKSVKFHSYMYSLYTVLRYFVPYLIRHSFLITSGGPGSNKGALVEGIMYLYPGWVCLSVGALLRRILQEDLKALKDEKLDLSLRRDTKKRLPIEKLTMLEDLMVKGELINQVICI